MKNKVIIITGASSGIGKACAELCGERGAKVVMAARNKERLEVVAEHIVESGGQQPLCVVTDVAKAEDCENLIKQTVEKFGKIDFLLNNAGVSMRALFNEVDLEVIHKVMDVNFWGTVYCTKFALPYLLKSKGLVAGVISIAGYIGLPARTGYGASKYAVRGFLETLRVENLKTGVDVLVAAPGFTTSNIRNTSMQKDGTEQGQSPREESKMMSAETCAKHIVNAMERRKRELILTFVEGKFTVWLNKWFPRLVEKLAYKHMAKEPDSPFK